MLCLFIVCVVDLFFWLCFLEVDVRIEFFFVKFGMVIVKCGDLGEIIVELVFF